MIHALCLAHSKQVALAGILLLIIISSLPSPCMLGAQPSEALALPSPAPHLSPTSSPGESLPLENCGFLYPNYC